MEAMAQ
jgi:hypothetical protein